ncbi:MAG: hypothetical protein EPO22_08665 [Dehalococcoidia bacterium]|nr:MAG: hypothetical protein EPO22_08665 [Dehalococcoidia bacterium]
MSRATWASGARSVLLILCAAGLALAWGLASVRTARAEISGPCGATLNGVDVKGVDSGDRGDDIKVGEHDRVPVTMTSATGFKSHKIQLEFAGRRWTVSEDTDDGSTTFSDSVNVDKYATYGVGLYKVVGVATLTDGTTCTGAATVDVSGNPLATVAGAVAAGTVVLGTVGALASGGLAAGSLGSAGSAAETAFAEGERERLASPDPYRYSYRWRPYRPWPWSMLDWFGCIVALPMLLLTVPFMAVTGGPGGPPPQPARDLPHFPRMRWAPRLSLLGIVSGLLAGLGVAVLLQQYSIEYPTQTAIIRDAVAGAAVYGLLLPTLGRLWAVRRFNGRIDALERARAGG